MTAQEYYATKENLENMFPGEIIYYLDTNDKWYHVKNCEESIRAFADSLGWRVFRERTGNKNLVACNPEEFEIREPFDAKHLHFKGEISAVHLPLNCSSCWGMFYRCKLPDNFNLGDYFDTSNVINMYAMFNECTFPENFTLGNCFDTSKVTDMHGMFGYCIIPENFTLEKRFDTSKVVDTSFMFNGCELPEGKTNDDFSSSLEIIDWLKSRKPQILEESAKIISSFN